MKADPRYPPLPAEIVTLLGEGDVNEAMKVLRSAGAMSQKEARRRIEAHLDQDAILRVQLETHQRARRRKFFLWFLVVDVVITAGIIYWFFFRGSV
jgi:predicted nucleic acid-binding protein